MAQNPLADLPPVFLGTSALSDRITVAVRQGRARKIGPRLYTTDTTSPPEEVIRKNLWPIVGLLAPGTVIAHRTALDARPADDGTVFLSAPHTRTVRLPGATLRLIRGPGPLPGDMPFVQNLWFASTPRALLENLRPTRRRTGVARAHARPDVEAILDRQLRTTGPDALNRLRDAARELAPALGAEREFVLLDDLIGTLLGTRTAELTTPAARARAAGRPYDEERLPIFDALIAALRQTSIPDRPDPLTSDEARRTLAFIDAYFSNFIEGTEFEIDEAIAIVFRHQIPTQRPADAHDILGTFQLLTDTKDMRRSVPEFAMDFDGFVALLKRRHATLMAGRPDIAPGTFKQVANRAGGTAFVHPELVLGTLEKGLEYVRALETAFARATFMMFLLTEVHPFTDGNGRLARILMNVELAAAGEAHIVIPTVYRDSYVQALRNLSRERHPPTLIGMLDFAQRFTAQVDCSSLPRALTVLTACNAFLKPTEGRLLLPQSAIATKRLRQGRV